MIVCPNCKHDNPEGATSCEACYTALPATKACPTCGASVQLDATFCGQCGRNLSSSETPTPLASAPATSGLPPTILTGKEVSLPTIDPLPDLPAPTPELRPQSSETTVPPTVAAVPVPPSLEAVVTPTEPVALTPIPEPAPEPATEPAPEPAPEIATPAAPEIATQIQSPTYQLLHVQTNISLPIPPQLEVIHIGKPNEQTPPDIDVSGFPSAEVVSRVHACIRVEGREYYIEDVGSANGTYINHNVIARGNRHLLRSGDRIGLGKGDLVTLIFQ